MKIFDAHISGSLSVSSSAEIEGDLTVLGTLFATVSGTTTNALTASEAPRYTLTSSFHSFTSSYTTGSFTGSFIGDGSNLYNIPASGVTGLNLNKITSGSVSASISPDRGLEVNTDLNVVGIITAKEIHTSIVTSSVLFESGSTIFGNTLDDTHQITGSVGVTGSLTLNNDPVVVNTTFNSYTSSANGRLNAVETSTGSLNSFTSSIDTTIKNKLNTENVISGSVQVTLSGTTGYSTFSSSIGSTTLNIENRVGSLETSTGALNTFSSSTNSRLNSIESATSSINSFTSSIDTTIKNKLNSENVVSGSIQILLSGTTGYSAFSSSIGTTTLNTENRVGSLETESGSIRTAFNSYTSSANGRLNLIETSTGSLNTFSSSTNTRLNSIETSTGSLNSFSSSTLSSLSAIHTSTGSLNTFSSSTLTRLTNLESASSSIRTDFNSYTSSANGRLSSIETSTGSLNTFSSSTLTRLSSIETSTSSLNSYTSSNTNNINAIHTATSSLNSYTSSNNTTLGTLQTATGALNTFSSSANTRLNAIETSTSSLNSFTSSIDTTIKNKLNTEGVISGSVQVTLSSTTGYSTFSSSLATTDAGQDSRLTSLEGKTGSYATTGSNIFQGDQTITGSLYISQNLIIGGSSSIQHITSSQLNIGDNIITVNAQNPSIRFGGLAVIDSGSSPQVSGSILFDSVNNQWIFVHQNQATVTSSVLLMGPETYNNLGGESYIAQNKIIKSTGIEHLAESNITDTGTKVSINSNTEITGSLITTGNVTSNANLVSNYSSGDEGGEITLNKAVTNTTLNGGITIDVWRDRVRIFETGGTNRGGFFNIAGLSASVGTNFQANADTASYVEYSNVANKPALVSGSSQISFSGLSNVPSGLVSGSSQVLNGSGVWSGSAQLPSGVVSGSSQISFGSISGVPSGLVSGSSQIAFGSITGVPSGLVSGSSQITLSSTTGFGSYLNQAVLTSSSPTFAAITIGKSGTDSTITFPAQTNDPGYIKHYESNNTAIMYFNVSDDTNDEFHFGYTADASTFRLRADGVVLEGTWQGSSISTSYTDAKVTSVNAGTGISVNATTGAVTITNTITNNNQLTNGAGYITSYTETDTLATVTGRGASTSTAISINNELTVTSGRVTIRTGGANTYGIVSGYDNNNHLMTMRANIAGSTSSPTLTAGHQMCFVEYAESNDTTGWFFKSSSTGTYQEIARITRSTFNYNGNTVYHSGNLTNLNQLTNGPGYITSYTETDTLASVTARGASTSTALTISGVIISTSGVYGYVRPAASNGSLLLGDDSGLATRGIVVNNNGGAVISTAASGQVILDTQISGTSVLRVNGNQTVTILGNTVYHSGNLTNLNQLTNGPGYITSYTETDTLATVTGRGASTSTSVTFSGGFNATGTQDRISSIRFHRLHPSAGSPLNIDSLDAFILSKTDGGYGGGTKASGSHNGFGVISLQTHSGNYFTQLGLDTNQNDLWIRSANDTTSFGSWIRMATRDWVQSVGYATLSGSNSFTNSYNEFGDGTGSVSNDGGWNGRLNLAGSQHARLDVTSVSDGIITTMYSHTGHAAGRVGTMSNHDLLLMIQGSGRVRLSTSGHLSPEANGTQNLGSSSYRWNTVFTSDLSMSNGIGDYTIVEGEEDLFIYNNKNNKVFKFLLQEVDPSIVPPKKI